MHRLMVGAGTRRPGDRDGVVWPRAWMGGAAGGALLTILVRAYAATRTSRQSGRPSVPIVVLVFGLLVTTVGVLQWMGHLGQSRHVDALSERAYLGVPTGVAFTGFGVLLLLNDVASVRRLFVPVTLVLLGLATSASS